EYLASALLAPAWREPVKPRSTVVLRGPPLRVHESVRLQSVKRRIERPFFYVQDVRDLMQVIGAAETVHGPLSEPRQNEQVQRSQRVLRRPLRSSHRLLI